MCVLTSHVCVTPPCVRVHTVCVPAHCVCILPLVRVCARCACVPTVCEVSHGVRVHRTYAYLYLHPTGLGPCPVARPQRPPKARGLAADHRHVQTVSRVFHSHWNQNPNDSAHLADRPYACIVVFASVRPQVPIYKHLTRTRICLYTST